MAIEEVKMEFLPQNDTTKGGASVPTYVKSDADAKFDASQKGKTQMTNISKRKTAKTAKPTGSLRRIQRIRDAFLAIAAISTLLSVVACALSFPMVAAGAPVALVIALCALNSFSPVFAIAMVGAAPFLPGVHFDKSVMDNIEGWLAKIVRRSMEVPTEKSGNKNHLQSEFEKQCADFLDRLRDFRLGQKDLDECAEGSKGFDKAFLKFLKKKENLTLLGNMIFDPSVFGSLHAEHLDSDETELESTPKQRESVKTEP
jgi:hypothetical protein